MIPLTIEVPQRTIEKIKALNLISGMDSDDIIQTFVETIDGSLDQSIVHASQAKINLVIEQEKSLLRSAGIDPDTMLLGSFPSEAYTPEPKIISKESPPIACPIIPLTQITPLEEKSVEDEDNDAIFIGSLGGEDDDFDEMDTALPEDLVEKLSSPKDDMTVRDKAGNETSYDDDFMRDIQDEIDGDDDGMDSIMAAASASMNGTSDTDGGATSSSKRSDAPTGEEGYVPDVLPVDLGLSSVTESDASATSFFESALTGRQGDKTKRDGVGRKSLQTSGW